MSYGQEGLSLQTIEDAQVRRLPEFRDGKGRLSHSDANGFDWALSQWSNAVCGEVGEAANLIKKIERGDFELDDVREALGDELADVVCYLVLLAHRAGVDLEAAVKRKFNAVSERVQSRVYIGDDNDWHLRPVEVAR